MYQPFLIANLRTGLELGMPSWLLPKDAFIKLENAFLQRGVLKKRQGYTEFAGLFHELLQNGGFESGSLPPWSFTANSPYVGSAAASQVNPGEGSWHCRISTTTTGTLWAHGYLVYSNISLLAGRQYRLRFKAAASGSFSIQVVVQPQAGGNVILSQTVNLGPSYTDFSFTFTCPNSTTYKLFFMVGLTPSGSTTDLDAVHLEEQALLPVMGLWNHVQSGGAETLLAFNTKRAFRYNDNKQIFEDIAGQDLFTGGDSHFFWLCNWLDVAFITNGNDRIYKYDGLSLTVFDIDYDGDLQNDVDTCSMIFVHKGHLVLLSPREKGSLQPQRARWSMPGNYNSWREQDWVDAPTSEWLIGAAFLKNDLLVFFERSIWKLAYTGDSRLPFKWVRLCSQEGCLAPMSVIDFSDEVLAMGPTNIIGTDGLNAYSISDRLPGFIVEVNQQRLALSYAGVDEALNLVYLSYPEAGYEQNNKCVIINYDDLSWSFFSLPYHCFGYFNQEAQDVTWDEVEQTWDELERVWDDRSRQAGYPVCLLGSYDGHIWKLGQVGSDNSQPISFEAVTGWLNPFVKEGRQARLGWVDFLVKRDPAITLQVDFKVDYSSAPYLSQEVVLDDGSDSDKIWVRVYSGAVGRFHQIRLFNLGADQTVEIEAICPYFAPAGRLY